MAGKRPIAEEIRGKADNFRDPEIEYQLVAYFIRVNPSASGSVKQDWFADIILQDIFMIVEDLRIVMSQAMIMAELRERSLMSSQEEPMFKEVLVQLFDEIDTSTFNTKNTRHMMEQVLRLYRSRRLISGCGDIIGTIRDFDLDSAEATMAELGSPISLVDDAGAGFYLDDYEQRISIIEDREQAIAESETGHVGVPTGIYRFDFLTGGVMPGEFGIVAGVTGVGKTAALIEFGCNAWEAGHDVMIVSGEMSKELLEFRIDSRLTRINGLKFRNAELSDDDMKTWENTIKMYRTIHNNFLYVVAYPRKFNMNDIERDITRVEEETGRKLKFLAVDYINILDPVNAGDGGWRDQSEAVWDFKGVVQDRELVGWTAGQVIDDAYDKELYTAQDLKYARAIGEASPIIVAIIRTQKDAIEKRMKFQVIKMRNAPPPTKPIALTPNLGIMRLHEEIRKTKSLKDWKSNVINEKEKTRKARPRKTLSGR